MFTQAERLISLRNLRPKKKEGFLKVISIFSFLGIMLGVAILIIVMSVMNGFKTDLTKKILGLNPHIIIESNSFKIENEFIGIINYCIMAIIQMEYDSDNIEIGGITVPPKKSYTWTDNNLDINTNTIPYGITRIQRIYPDVGQSQTILAGDMGWIGALAGGRSEGHTAHPLEAMAGAWYPVGNAGQ